MKMAQAQRAQLPFLTEGLHVDHFLLKDGQRRGLHSATQAGDGHEVRANATVFPHMTNSGNSGLTSSDKVR